MYILGAIVNCFITLLKELPFLVLSVFRLEYYARETYHRLLFLQRQSSFVSRVNFVPKGLVNRNEKMQSKFQHFISKFMHFNGNKSSLFCSVCKRFTHQIRDTFATCPFFTREKVVRRGAKKGSHAKNRCSPQN